MKKESVSHTSTFGAQGTVVTLCVWELWESVCLLQEMETSAGSNNQQLMLAVISNKHMHTYTDAHTVMSLKLQRTLQ